MKAVARGSDRWKESLLDKITHCRFFALYNTRAACHSEWVDTEIKRFYDIAYSQDNRRRMFMLCMNPPDQSNVPALFRDFLYDKSEDELV